MIDFYSDLSGTSNGEIIAIEYNEKAVADILDLGVSDVVVKGDATHPIELVEQVRHACSNADYQADLTINVVNVPHTELATILLTRKDGRILFFSMATSFTEAALGTKVTVVELLAPLTLNAPV